MSITNICISREHHAGVRQLTVITEEDIFMRIAAAYINGDIDPHFGRTSQLKVYEIEDGSVTAASLLETQGIGHGALALALNQLHIKVLICGGIGPKAKSALNAVDIAIVPGITGNADDALDAYLDGTLKFDPEATCEEEDEQLGCSPSMCASCSSTSCGD